MLAMHRHLWCFGFSVWSAPRTWHRSALSANARCCSSPPSSRPRESKSSPSPKPPAHRSQNVSQEKPKYWRDRGAGKSPGAASEYFVVHEERVSALADILMYSFEGESERRLLMQSMLHKSCVGSTVEIEGTKEVLCELASAQCNDKLEWLGDKVFGLQVADFLYEELPELEEGQLSFQQSCLISRRRCNEIAVELGIDKFLVCSQYLHPTPVGRLSSRTGSFLEALVGALYLAGGEAAVKVFFETRIQPLMRKMIQEGERNWKSELLELVCRCGLDHLDGSHFRIVDLQASARDKAAVPWIPCYRAGIYIHDQMVMTAMESSKRRAHQAVSKAFLLELEELGGEGGALAGLRSKLGDNTRNWRNDLLALLQKKCQLDVADCHQLKICELPQDETRDNEASADDLVKAGVFIHGCLVASAASSTKFLAQRDACRVILERLEAAENPAATVEEFRLKMS